VCGVFRFSAASFFSRLRMVEASNGFSAEASFLALSISILLPQRRHVLVFWSAFASKSSPHLKHEITYVRVNCSSLSESLFIVQLDNA